MHKSAEQTMVRDEQAASSYSTTGVGWDASRQPFAHQAEGSKGLLVAHLPASQGLKQGTKASIASSELPEEHFTGTDSLDNLRMAGPKSHGHPAVQPAALSP